MKKSADGYAPADALDRAKKELDGTDLKAAWHVLCEMETEANDVFTRAEIMDSLQDSVFVSDSARVVASVDLLDAIARLQSIYKAMQQVVTEANEKEAT